MVLRIKEYKYKLDRVSNTLSENLLVDDFFDVYPGWIHFLGKKEGYDYSHIFNVIEINESSIVIEAFSDNQFAKMKRTLILEKEVIFKEKRPKGMQQGYYYSITLLKEAIKNENQ